MEPVAKGRDPSTFCRYFIHFYGEYVLILSNSFPFEQGPNYEAKAKESVECWKGLIKAIRLM